MPIINALKTPVGFNNEDGSIKMAPVTIRYADKAEVTGLNANNIIADFYKTQGIAGIPGGVNHVMERQTKSKAGIIHHNVRVKLVLPSFQVVTGPMGPTAKSKQEEVTISVSVSLPARIKNDTDFTSLLSTLIGEQIAALGLAYSGSLDLVLLSA